MSLQELRKKYEERKLNLIERLKHDKKKLSLSTQHQIYGAIQEIEGFLESIDFFLGKEAESNFDIDLSKEKDSPFVEKTKELFFDSGKKTKLFLNYVFVKAPCNIKDCVSLKLKEYKKKRDLKKELKKRLEEELKKKINENNNSELNNSSFDSVENNLEDRKTEESLSFDIPSLDNNETGVINNITNIANKKEYEKEFEESINKNTNQIKKSKKKKLVKEKRIKNIKNSKNKKNTKKNVNKK